MSVSAFDRPSGRVVFVSGGGRGIGRAIALRLAAHGDEIAVGDIRADDAAQTVTAIEETGGRAVAIELDVTDSASVARAVEETLDLLGPVEVLVNNAGWDEMRPFLETDEPFWDRVIDVNFKGCLRLTRATLPGMVERNWGRIVNIGSDAGRVGSSLESVYSGAKGAVIAFTKTIAREVARTGVTANTVCPGPTDTPMLAEVAAGGPGEKIIEAMKRAVPMKRLGAPEDVANAVAFLASDEASFITGQTLSVSGGLTMV
jgi:2-hydroxycyclohexanecarboxyl-CoA dehydrogenase